MSLSYKLSLSQNIQFGIKNIFDFKEPEMISNISGRNFYIALKINFKNN